MAAEGDNNFAVFIYTGAEGERIPRNATHVIVHELTTFVRDAAFYHHRNIVEVVCHENVEKIGCEAFLECRSLRRVIMPGVKVLELSAFGECKALTDVECGELEIIGDCAIAGCESLTRINLSSVRFVEKWAFGDCHALLEATFSNKLERIKGNAFSICLSLERITIPLKDGLIEDDVDVFTECVKLNQVDLLEGVHETANALQVKEWRNDMKEEINSINRILPNTHAGNYQLDDYGGKTEAIRTWITSVLHKIIPYQAEHRCILDDEVTALLHPVLPHEVVMNNIIPLLELP